MLKGKISFPKEIPKEFFRKDKLLILLLSGILLMVITIPVEKKEKEEEKQVNSPKETFIVSEENVAIEYYTQYLESQLEEILSLIENAGKVRVMVTLEDAGEKIVEKDAESSSESVEEADGEGGKRISNSSSVKEVSIFQENDETGHPYIAKEKSPLVSGILVIAQGGDNALVVKNITEATQALFDIDTHKIKVIKGN